MTQAHQPKNQDGSSPEPAHKLMVSGYVCPKSSCALSVEVRRGMPVFSQEGQEVGKVAAVLLSGDRQTATHVLLGRLPEVSGYWLIPIDSIVEVGEKGVQLSLPLRAVESLPRWHSA